MTVVDKAIAVSIVDGHPIEDSLLTQPLLEVVAPANLPEGYTFDASADGRVHRVTIPAGGVNEGDTFKVPMSMSAGESHSHSPRVTGYWKDGLCDCCRFGGCHPVICNAFWCPLVLLGQVMHQLNLTWLGRVRGAGETRSSGTFGILVAIWIAYLITLYTIGGLQWLFVDVTGNITNETGYYMIRSAASVLECCFFIFLIVLACKTRKHIRDKYNIREQNCQGCEDCCCAFWCGCCTVTQMARQTADYDTYAARCCNETGLPTNVVPV